MLLRADESHQTYLLRGYSWCKREPGGYQHPAIHVSDSILLDGRVRQ